MNVVLCPYVINTTLTSANTEYGIVLPLNTAFVTLQSRDGTELRHAWETGKVAASTAPFATIRASGAFSSPQKIVVPADFRTLYLATAGTNVVVEILCFTTTDPRNKLTLTVPDDTTMLLSASTIDLSGYTLADENQQILTATLATDNGTLSLASTTGLDFATGDGTDDATMTFSGTVADILTALDPVTLTPATKGVAEVSLSVTDGNGTTVSDATNVSVLNNVSTVDEPSWNDIPGDDPAVPGGVCNFTSVQVVYLGVENLDVQVLLDGFTYTPDLGGTSEMLGAILADINNAFTAGAFDFTLGDTDPHVVTFRVRRTGQVTWADSQDVNLTSDGM